MTASLNPNQFALAPVRGEIDWSIAKRGILTVQVSANQATALVPGQSVILDPAVTGAIPQVKAAANSDPKAFYIVFNAKQGSYVSGDILEVTGNFGPVMYLEAEATIAMGATVEDVVANGTVQTLASAKARGMALLNGVAGDLFPVMLNAPVLTAS